METQEMQKTEMTWAEKLQGGPLPVCKLVGTDGNVFAIIGAVCRVLKRAKLSEAAQEFQNRATSSGSYDAVLALVFDYVEVE